MTTIVYPIMVITKMALFYFLLIYVINMPIKYRESTIGYLITDGLKNKKNFT